MRQKHRDCLLLSMPILTSTWTTILKNYLVEAYACCSCIMNHMFSFKFLRGITLPLIMGITCMIFSCVYFGKAHLYIIMIMQVRKYPCQHSAGQVLVNGMPSGALTWMLRYVHVNAFLASHILFIIAHNII